MEILDFRGEPCPTPLVKTVRKIARMKENDEIKILTDEKECVEYIKEIIPSLGVELLSIDEEEGFWIIHIKKITI